MLSWLQTARYYQVTRRTTRATRVVKAIVRLIRAGRARSVNVNARGVTN